MLKLLLAFNLVFAAANLYFAFTIPLPNSLLSLLIGIFNLYVANSLYNRLKGS